MTQIQNDEPTTAAPQGKKRGPKPRAMRDETARLEPRASRNQESREASATRELGVDFEPTGPLPDIKARSGYAQRWVRVVSLKDSGKPDLKNIHAAQRRGWTPRRPDTVPQSLQWLTVQHGGLGGVIGTHDMVLMERSDALERREAAVKREARRERVRAVKQNMFADFAGSDRHNVVNPDFESEGRVSRGNGQGPGIQDD